MPALQHCKQQFKQLCHNTTLTYPSAPLRVEFLETVPTHHWPLPISLLSQAGWRPRHCARHVLIKVIVCPLQWSAVLVSTVEVFVHLSFISWISFSIWLLKQLSVLRKAALLLARHHDLLRDHLPDLCLRDPMFI